ncbi:PucR family transcriptional regulator [Wukongibacter baidiensis]|uniref:PucR family transcriptional regulator n=1 Tax=Wukongibacter baidiensis TaxID=1723361 RepID=UPI003D7F7C06
MSITISEALKLDNLKDFRLVAGEWGLDKKIEQMGILDHEIIDKSDNIEVAFGKGDFVLTNFTVARNDDDLLIQSIKELIKAGVTGLAIKNIFYSELPNEIIEYANEKSFPIFIFANKVYFEDIITDVIDAIRDSDNYELLETKVDIIVKNNISKTMIRELALEINSSFKENFIAAYCKEKKYVNNTNIIKLLERYKRSKDKSIYNAVFKYRSGILIIFSYEDMNESSAVKSINKLIGDIGIDDNKYIVGISNNHSSLDELARGINEGLYAVDTSEISDGSITFYKDIGIYKVIMPHVNEVWINEFYQEIITPLKNYDKKYNTQILTTAIKYIDNDGNVKRTSEELFQHDNTIRYRINKMKEILGMEDLDGSFYEQLSIAIKIYKIFNPNYS